MKITPLLKKVILEQSRIELLFDALTKPSKDKEGNIIKPKLNKDEFTILVNADPTTRTNNVNMLTADSKELGKVKAGKYVQWLIKNYLSPKTERQPGNYGYEKEVKRVKEQYDQEIGNLKKKLEEQEKARKEEQFIKILESYGLSKDDFQDVLDFAKQNGIINFETAVRLYVSERLQKSRNSLPIRARQDDDVIKRYSGIDGKDKLMEDVLSMLGR